MGPHAWPGGQPTWQGQYSHLCPKPKPADITNKVLQAVTFSVITLLAM